MKYMGSKRYMLANGLGELLREQLPSAKRFIDPFCGSGGVVNFVATNQNFKGEIIAGDLQKYAVVLSKAVIERTNILNPEYLKEIWIEKTKKEIKDSKLLNQAEEIDKNYKKSIKIRVNKARKLCETLPKIGPIWNAYGGHYFSPKQALILDYLLKTLPKKTKYRNVCLAAIIIAASRAAAAPGHTAQPFQPTTGAGKFIKIAWHIDVFKSCEKALEEITPLHSLVKGKAVISDAKKLISKLKKGDLVLLDPPYSGVQYSRFYHVLETIARGKCGPVTGVGRYPDISERPQSKFSNAGQSLKALDELLSGLSKREVKVIFTFPKGKCSNGLSGDQVLESAKKYFNLDKKNSRIHTHAITGKFSTLGGNNKLNKNKLTKKSRVKSEELVLLLEPRKIKNN
ncbi:MAG: DNA adenine methylase [Candidatus Pacebacteria bacterium]|nr:DNA adenine methylase [Candidatus Paceibacterota bacterium]